MARVTANTLLPEATSSFCCHSGDGPSGLPSPHLTPLCPVHLHHVQRGESHLPAPVSTEARFSSLFCVQSDGLWELSAATVIRFIFTCIHPGPVPARQGDAVSPRPLLAALS